MIISYNLNSLIYRMASTFEFPWGVSEEEQRESIRECLTRCQNGTLLPNAKDTYCNASLLMCAVRRGLEAEAELLLLAGADIHATDAYGWTSLHYACTSAHDQIFKMLIDYGADVFHEAIDGKTALHAAGDYGQDRAVVLLLACGADIRSN